uniref:MYND-type domain-containing protein n=1 Tax=Skeletonema marinoi TaxID=267567 RepID=A0A7S2LYT7_9STRA|mmetsp:Transcript_32412/g.54729  ORF Transcript_32412/g.54729 Transcript_32412/m.54729 type:complete len:611 (+) Transcript_32412:122-1954(+)
MPSRKKTQGKARKAAKAKAKEEASAATSIDENRDSLSLHLQQLQLGNTHEPPCYHGCVPFPADHICAEFLNAFMKECRASNITHALQATIEKYAQVWNDPELLRRISSYICFIGTQAVLKDTQNFEAIKLAVLAFIFEHRIENNTSELCTEPQLRENTAIRFFKKRIPCSCLDQLYINTKGISKLKVCYDIDGDDDIGACRHGFNIPDGHICDEFLDLYIGTLLRAGADAGGGGVGVYEAARTETMETYAIVWGDAAYLKMIKASFLAQGTKLILDGEEDRAILSSHFANYFGQQIAILSNTQATLDEGGSKNMVERADQRQLIKYFHDQITCSCLDEKYNEVVTRGRCFNIHCKHDAGYCCSANCHEDTNKCNHGFISFPDEQCREDLDKYLLSFGAAWEEKKKNPFQLAMRGSATHGKTTENEFLLILLLPTYLSANLSYLLALGTQHILEGRNEIASQTAALVRYFEHSKGTVDGKIGDTPNWSKMLEFLITPDEHTLISFFRNRISCSCLSAKYKEVKSIVKMSFCHNLSCSLPDNKVELSSRRPCSRCRKASYCSRQCQKADWPTHRAACDKYVADMAEINRLYPGIREKLKNNKREHESSGGMS